MLSEHSLNFIKETAIRYGATKILLLESCPEMTQSRVCDIDLAVEGVAENDIDRLWDDLIWSEALDRRTVDLFRLEDEHWLVPIMHAGGTRIYEAPEAFTA